jgi:hypothetical protein
VAWCVLGVTNTDGIWGYEKHTCSVTRDSAPVWYSGQGVGGGGGLEDWADGQSTKFAGSTFAGSDTKLR